MGSVELTFPSRHSYECNNSHGKLTRNLQKDSYITKAARKIYTELGRIGRNTSGWIYAPERINKKRDITRMERVVGNEWVQPRLDIPVLGSKAQETSHLDRIGNCRDKQNWGSRLHWREAHQCCSVPRAKRRERSSLATTGSLLASLSQLNTPAPLIHVTAWQGIYSSQDLGKDLI